MGKLVKSIFGGAPKVSSDAKDDASSQRLKAKESRAALFRTEGGASGEELDPDAVKSRNSLLGN